MAGASSDYQSFGADTLLSPSQQDLLVAALSSQATGSNTYEDQPRRGMVQGRDASRKELPNSVQQDHPSNLNPSEVATQTGFLNADALASLNAEDASFADWLGANNDIPYDAVDDGQFWLDEQDGAQAEIAINDDADEERDLHDKRKIPSGGTDDAEGAGNKRRESEEKVAKKPGRKPLISEASTVSHEFIT